MATLTIRPGDPRLAVIHGIDALQYAARTGDQIYRRRTIREGVPVELGEAFRIARDTGPEVLFAFVPG